MSEPIFLMAQGRLKPGAEPIYEKYVQGVLPLIKEFGIEAVAVGAGFESEFTTKSFPLNLLMKLPDEETLGKFLGDPRYLEIKKFRDEAYEELTLSSFRGRAPRT